MSQIPIRCLIVDDEAPIRTVLCRGLAQQDLTTMEAASARTALQVLHDHPEIVLVVSDVYMPDMDGIALLREMRGRYPDTAVIMMTGVAEAETAVACLQAGAMDYIVKPFMMNEVRARVAKALEKRDLILQNRDYQLILEARVTELAGRTKEMFLQQIQLAGRMLEAKDRYTLGHSQRVRDYALATAKGMGFVGDILEDFRVGAELHDIGKIGTSDTILNKPGPLTPEEYDAIKRHTSDGEDILRPILGDRPKVLHIVRSHHERMDGSGFPDGLVGHDIPIEARIVSVVDAYDAMTSTRAYRPPLSSRDAVHELRRRADSHFDGNVIEAFLEVFPNPPSEELPAAS